MPTGKYPRSKTRDFEVSEVKGNATRFFGDNSTFPEGGSGQKRRGEGAMVSIKSQSIPNRGGVSKMKVKNP